MAPTICRILSCIPCLFGMHPKCVSVCVCGCILYMSPVVMPQMHPMQEALVCLSQCILLKASSEQLQAINEALALVDLARADPGTAIAAYTGGAPVELEPPSVLAPGRTRWPDISDMLEDPEAGAGPVVATPEPPPTGGSSRTSTPASSIRKTGCWVYSTPPRAGPEGPEQEAADLAMASQAPPLAAGCQRISRDAKATAKARAKAQAEANVEAKAVAKAEAKAAAKPKGKAGAKPQALGPEAEAAAARKAQAKRVHSKAWHAEVDRMVKAKMTLPEAKASAKLVAKAALQAAGFA